MNQQKYKPRNGRGGGVTRWLFAPAFSKGDLGLSLILIHPTNFAISLIKIPMLSAWDLVPELELDWIMG